MDTQTPPTERTSSPEGLQFEDIVLHGHRTTILRDQNGNIIYPAYVPPATQAPTSPTNTKALRESEKPGLSAQEQHERAQTDPLPRKGSRHKDAQRRIRPRVDKKWGTEAPRRARSQTSPLPSTLKRAGTSYLDKAIWQSYGNEESSSSSSSSDDEEECGEQADRARPRKKVGTDDLYRRFRVGNENYKTKGKIKGDGRLRITVKETAHTGYLAKALGTAVKKVVPLGEDEAAGGDAKLHSASQLFSAATATSARVPQPKLNIVIMVIGSRGDAQPFLKIGKILQEKYGHRVRIATHPAFRDFVEKDAGLEFFSVGGDPSELMAFMVKNPGMVPSIETVRAGDIGRRRAAMAEMFEGFWRACVNATDDEKDIRNLKMMGERDPFVADAIIANPPSFAHIHCAEALGIPLHLMFTFPYTPTQQFPHPLASIKKSNIDPGYTNFISYPLVEMMVWQGLGDLVNDFRVKTLGLDPVSTLWAPGATYRLHVPFTYLWSPGLAAKPEDWGDEIDISGFVFLDLASSFKPPPELESFLGHGEQPIYIGFGSIVVDDADRFTHMIFEAVKLAGVRALVSKGWGGLGQDYVPENVFMLENTPHDWLFPKVRACVIHGGAGTTAIALKCGKPTMIVPFFGDQHFWGSVVANANAGPEPVPYKHLTAEKLAEGIKCCLTEEVQKGAGKIAKDIELEGDGAENAVFSFHLHLNLQGMHSMRCSILEDRVAAWKLDDTNVKLSPLAADIIVEKGLVPWRKLRLLRHMEWNDFEGPGEPVTGLAGTLMSTVGDIFGGVGSVPYRLARTSQKRRKKRHKRRKRGKQAQTAAKRPQTQKVTGEGSQQTETGDFAKLGDRLTGKTDANKENRRRGATSTSNTANPGGSRAHDAASIHSGGSGTTAEESDAYVDKVTTGVGRTAAAIARAPVDLSLAVAQGFHNAPRLYGDDTVRRPPRVTGMRSGLKAARAEFVYGLYDGVTGLVKLPVRGAKRDGVVGLAKGTGMGLTGFVLKNISAIAGPIGYTLKGMAKQVERGKQPIKFVRKARIVQGQREVMALDRDARKATEKEVLRGWHTMRELWEALEYAEKKKGFKGRLSARKKRGRSAAFESVGIAEKALAAIRKGQPISSVVGTEKELRKSEGRGRPSADRRRSLEKRQSGAEAAGDGGKKGEENVKKEEGIPEEDVVEEQHVTDEMRPSLQRTKSADAKA